MVDSAIRLGSNLFSPSQRSVSAPLVPLVIDRNKDFAGYASVSGRRKTVKLVNSGESGESGE